MGSNAGGGIAGLKSIEGSARALPAVFFLLDIQIKKHVRLLSETRTCFS